MNVEPLEPAADFPHLGQTVVFNNNDWTDLYQNTLKERHWWEVVEKVLTTRTVAVVWAQEILYTDVVQMVLLYGR